MSHHIKNIVKGAFYHLRNIAKIRKYINTATAEVLVHSFISSKLDFCNSLLYGLPKYEINKLQSVLNAAARVIACLRKFDHVTNTLKELHWLPVEQRKKFIRQNFGGGYRLKNFISTVSQQRPLTYIIHHTYITFISPRIYKGSCRANFSEKEKTKENK